MFVRAAHPLPYFLTDDTAERRRGNIPQCHAARPMGQMDGWMDGQTQADDRWMGRWMDGWVDAAVTCNPHTLTVFIVAALTAARAFVVFKTCVTSETIKYPTSGHMFDNKSLLR